MTRKVPLLAVATLYFFSWTSWVDAQSKRKSPVEHGVRGHTRRTKSGKMTYVDPHRRGSGSKPVSKSHSIRSHRRSRNEEFKAEQRRIQAEKDAIEYKRAVNAQHRSNVESWDKTLEEAGMKSQGSLTLEAAEDAKRAELQEEQASRSKSKKPSPGAPEQFTGRCVSLADSDTLVVRRDNGALRRSDEVIVTVRIHGIDAPDRDQPFNSNALRFLWSLVGNKQISVKGTATELQNHVVGSVAVGGFSASEEMVKRGLARHLKDLAPEETRLADLETEAKAAKRGLWFNFQPSAP